MLHACQNISYRKTTMAGKAADSGALIYFGILFATAVGNYILLYLLLDCSRDRSGSESFDPALVDYEQGWNAASLLEILCSIVIILAIVPCWQKGWETWGEQEEKYPIAIGSQSTHLQMADDTNPSYFPMTIFSSSLAVNPSEKCSLPNWGQGWIFALFLQKQLSTSKCFFSDLKKKSI